MLNNDISIVTGLENYILSEILRVFGSTSELAGVLRVIDGASVKFTATYTTDERIYAFLEVGIPESESWVADVELDFPGISDPLMALAFADAVIDEAQYWSSRTPLVIEDEYFEIDCDIARVAKGGK